MSDFSPDEPHQLPPKVAPGPLAGLRILELGHFVAAPFCARLLADLGAEVIKIEPPSGDPVRRWGAQLDGQSLWWSVHARNKKSVALDLKCAAAVRVVLDIAKTCDAVVENFRPGQLGRLGLGDEALREANPGLVIAHISGFGQTGPYRDRAAFGVIGEAMGGLRHLTNHEPGSSDGPPVRAGISIGDSIAGLYAAFGILAELWQRERSSGRRPVGSVDVALTEAVLSLMEGMLPEYGALGKIRQPSGSRIPTAAPSSAYRSADGKWIIIAANSDALFAKLARVLGKPELADDPHYATNPARVANVDSLDQFIEAWTTTQTSEALVTVLEDAGVPCTRIYDASDCASDAQFAARGMVRETVDPLFGSLLHPGIVPHHPESPGGIRWAGPALGQHTDEVLGELLNLSPTEIGELRAQGAIS